MANEIELIPKEQIVAATVGVIRQVDNLKKGRKEAHGADPRLDWQTHIDGCLGEMAFSKYSGLYWSGANEFRAPDVGEFQVRTTSWQSGKLLLHERDEDGLGFVLVVGLNGKYRIAGWLFGREGKVDQHWDATREKFREELWAVEQRFLHDPAKLRRKG